MNTPFFSPFSQTIGKFINDPITNWQRFFNPQVVFNYNPEDQGVEAHVLGRVGSYGSQISTIIQMIEALRERLESGSYSEKGKEAQAEFETLRVTACEAVAAYRGQMTPADIVSATRDLGERDPAAVIALDKKLRPLVEQAARRAGLQEPSS